MKFLNIIINAKNEYKNLNLTLDSISKLKNKEILVTVIGNVKKDLVKRFFNDAIIIDNRRKLGNNFNDALNAKTEYVTFANSGDLFTIELLNTINVLKNQKPNVLRTILTEKYLSVDGKMNLGTVNYLYVETLRAHFFNKKFLVDNNYLFNEDLDIYAELNLYKKIALKNNMMVLNVNTLISSFSIISLGVNELPENIKNIEDYYNSLVDVIDTLKDTENYKYYILNVIYALYIVLESDKFLSLILRDKKRIYDKLVYNLYLKYNDVIYDIPNNIKENTLNIEYQKQKRLDINLKIKNPFDIYFEKLKLEFEVNTERFLDVIIPEYNGEEFIFRLLDSVINQKEVDFNQIGIIIVNDCSPNRIKEYKFEKYANLNIEYIINEKNVGQGPTRQNGIDHSKAKYICFMDQDDMFNPEDDLALSKMIANLKTLNPNCLIGNVVEELKTLNGVQKKVNKSDNPLVYVHGLFIKRQYLIDKNIRFNPKLRQLEDTYFTRLLYLTGEDIRTIDIDIYLWKNNEKSQVRQKNDLAFNVRNIDYFFIYLEDATEFLEQKKIEHIDRFVVQATFAIFIISQSYLFDKEILKDKKIEVENRLYGLVKKYQKYFDVFNKEELDELLEDERQFLARSSHNIRPYVTFEEFKENMKKRLGD